MEPTTRLRKAFKYPVEEDSDSQPEDLDEEEQESLIKTFIDNDAAKTEAYKVPLSLFSSLPSSSHLCLYELTTYSLTESLPRPPNPLPPPLSARPPPTNQLHIPPNPLSNNVPLPNNLRALSPPHAVRTHSYAATSRSTRNQPPEEIPRPPKRGTEYRITPLCTEGEAEGHRGGR